MSKPEPQSADSNRARGPLCSHPTLVLVVARAANGVIGRDKGLPWHLPDDLRHFKSLTLGKPMLMGRRTFEAIGRPLPRRLNIVLTRDRSWRADGVTVVHDLDAAFAAASPAAELMVIGGADLYRQLLPIAARIELTEVHGDVPGDTLLADFPATDWRETARVRNPADTRHQWPYSFVTLERRTSGGAI
jgi:dihydrofolate reductase